MGHAILVVVLLLVTGSIAEDCEHERVRWRVDRRRSMLEEDDEPTTGRYKLPAEAARQLRAVLRDVHTVDLRRRVRELVSFHRLHTDNAESDSTRAEYEDAQWQSTRDGGAEPDVGSRERTADGTTPLRDELLDELLSPPRRRSDTRSERSRGVTYNSIIRRTVVVS